MLVCLVCPKQTHINSHHHHHHHHEVSSASSPAQATVMDSDRGADLYGNCKISSQSPTDLYSKQECHIRSFTNQVKEIVMKFSASCAPPRLCSNKHEMNEDSLDLPKHTNHSDGIGNRMSDPEQLCMMMMKVDERHVAMAESDCSIRPRLAAFNYEEILPLPKIKRSRRNLKQQKRESEEGSSAMDEAEAEESEEEEAEESEEFEEGEEWVAQVEPGVCITLMALPNGSNSLKRIRFRQEMFSKWEAQQWWVENCDMVRELYSVTNKGRPNNAKHSPSTSSSSSSSSSNQMLQNTPVIASKEGSPQSSNNANYSNSMIHSRLMQLSASIYQHEREYDHLPESLSLGNKYLVDELFLHQMRRCDQLHEEEEEDDYFCGANHRSSSTFKDPCLWGSSNFRGVKNMNNGFSSIYFNLQLHDDEQEDEFEDNVVDHDYGLSSMNKDSRHDRDIVDHHHHLENTSEFGSI